jgi:aspartyl-tRNA(Asn)/glutamyl-tRNA(Gln) amidotransferase subunit A
MLDSRPDHYTAPVRERISAGREVSAIRYLQALRVCRTLRAGVDALLTNVDALLLPTMPIVAPPLGATDVALDDGTGGTSVRAAMLRNTQLFNLTGHPAISIPIPCGGLPIGLQLVGHRGETMRLAAVAAACAALLQQSTL